MTCASEVDEAELDDVPLGAQLGKHDVHAPADLRQIARLFGDLDWSDASLEPERSGFDSLDGDKVLDPVLVRNVVRVEGRRPLHLLVEEGTKPVGTREVPRSIGTALDPLRPLFVRDVAVFVEPQGQLLRHRARRSTLSPRIGPLTWSNDRRC